MRLITRKKMGTVSHHPIEVSPYPMDIKGLNNGSSKTSEEDEKRNIKNDGGKQKMGYELLKENVYEYLNTATTHGLGKIANASNSFTRTLWILIVALLVAYLIQAVYKLHLKLIKRDYKVTVKTNKVNALLLPAITICDNGPKLLDGPILAINLTTKNKTWRTPLQSDQDHLRHMLATNKKKNYSQSINNFILREESGNMPFCHFSGDQCSYDKHFKALPTIHKGQCFTFNHGGTARQVLKGPQMGIFALFHLEKQNNNTKSVPGTATQGIEIFVHEPNIKNPTHSGGILGKPGHLTRIELKRTLYERLPEPYPDKCTESYKNGQDLHECQMNCIAMHQKEQCNVVSLTLQVYLHEIEAAEWVNGPDIPLPTTTKDHECLERVTDSYAKERLICDCFLPCTENTYDVSVSENTWPHADNAEEVIKLIKAKFGIVTKAEEIDKYLVAIQVYYGKLGYTEILQIPAYSLDEFSYDLGGLLGLIIGASVFSAFEMLLFFLFSFYSQLEWFFHRGKPH